MKIFCWEKINNINFKFVLIYGWSSYLLDFKIEHGFVNFIKQCFPTFLTLRSTKTFDRSPTTSVVDLIFFLFNIYID